MNLKKSQRMRKVKQMKMIKNVFKLISSFFKTIYGIIDKIIIIPVTKFLVVLRDKFGNRSNRFEKWIRKKNTLVFISLLLSVVLFLYVDSESTTIITDSAEVLYDQKVSVTYNNNSYVIEGLPKSVDVTLIGRKVDLYLAKQLSGGVVKADLARLGEGMHTIKLDYDCAINTVKYKIDPSTVNVTVYPKISQTRTAVIDVINKNKLDKKLSIESVELENKEIVIKGAEHTLNEVSTVKALIDAKKIVNPKIGESELDDIKLVAYDSDGNVIKNIEMEPKKLKAKLVINSPSKEVNVKVIPTGEVEFGKAINDIKTDVTKVTIYGEQDVLDSIDNLPVEVDVSGLNETKTYDIIVSKPSGIKEISATNLKVTISLAAVSTKEVNDVSIETINLDPKYKAVAVGEHSSKTTVVVKGTQDVINQIDASMIKAQVDLNNYVEGEYEVSVKVTGEDNKATYVAKTTKIKVKITKREG